MDYIGAYSSFHVVIRLDMGICGLYSSLEMIQLMPPIDVCICIGEEKIFCQFSMHVWAFASFQIGWTICRPSSAIVHMQGSVILVTLSLGFCFCFCFSVV